LPLTAKKETRMMRCVPLLVTLLLAGCATGRLDNIPLVWKPTSSLGAAGRVDLADVRAAKVKVAPMADRRQAPSLIGENREESMPRTVTTRDDVAAFLTVRFKMLLTNAGLDVVDSDETAIVKGEVKQFFVAETSTYEAQVRVLITVADPSGNARWSGVTEGSARRFGRSYRAENYYEVLSDAVVTAVAGLLTDDGFQKAVAGKP
jgi:hypothetical protein